MNPDDITTTITIPELIALLAKAPANVKWYLENRTVADSSYAVVDELTNINFILGEGFELDLCKNSYQLTTAAYASLQDDFTFIIKDSQEEFYALTAKEVTTFDIGDFFNLGYAVDKKGFAMPSR